LRDEANGKKIRLDGPVRPNKSGFFFRMVYPGIYSLSFESEKYHPVLCEISMDPLTASTPYLNRNSTRTIWLTPKTLKAPTRCLMQ